MQTLEDYFQKSSTTTAATGRARTEDSECSGQRKTETLGVQKPPASPGQRVRSPGGRALSPPKQPITFTPKTKANTQSRGTKTHSPISDTLSSPSRNIILPFTPPTSHKHLYKSPQFDHDHDDHDDTPSKSRQKGPYSKNTRRELRASLENLHEKQ